ncbi:MAG: proline--tRNA ligase, partial [Endomicrobiia bacterium]
MKLSEFLLPTLRETPQDADTISNKLMIRAGMIRKLASGIYEWLPLGLRVLKKVEQIVREEMNAIGGQEVWLPLLLPKELWEETGRWQLYGDELFRLKDRKGSDFCLGPTHEEVITDIVRKEVRSYRQLPIMLYQFGLKFRDEIRPRFGVMRAREFYMKDAYSFHATEEDAENYYKKVFDAYSKICERCGFKYRIVEAVTGAIGGKFSHEFMVLAETGEEEIVWCECGYSANVEKAQTIMSDEERAMRKEERAMNNEERGKSNEECLEEVYTPNL